MLYIILGILKVIGSLLLALLLLILLIVLSVLFVPVRYRGRIVKDAKELSAVLHVSWLLHVVSVRLEYDAKSGKRLAEIRVFGVSLAAVKRFLAKRKQRKDMRHREPVQSKRVSRGKTGRAPGMGQGSKERNVPPEAESKEKLEEESGKAESAKAEFAKTESETRAEKRGFERLSERIRAILYKIRTFCDKMRKTVLHGVKTLRALGRSFEQIFKKPRELSEKLQSTLAFAQEYEVGPVLVGLKEELFELLRFYRPRRIHGWLRFGTGDPALTGELTGVLYLLLPVRARFAVEPDFNEAVFETEAEFAGYIRACHLIRTGWHLYRDKKLRRLITRVRRKGD